MPAVRAFLDALTLFGLGYSWGGFESLVIPFDCTKYRTATQWAPGGPTLRFHIGLEDTGDLIADLERGFAALSARASADQHHVRATSPVWRLPPAAAAMRAG